MVLVSANYPDPYYNGVDGSRYSYGRSRPTDRIKKQIFEATTDNPYRSQHYLRSVIKSSLDKLKTCNITLSDGSHESVEVIYARPDRAVAKMKKSRNLKLPMMSFDIINIQPSETRQRPNFNLEYWTIKSIKTGRYSRVAALAPKAVDLEAKVHLWAKNNSDLYQMLEYITAQFNPHMRVSTDLNVYTHAFIESISDIGQVDLGDREDKVLRKTVNLNIEGYIPSQKYTIQSNGEIEQFYYRIVFIEDASVETLLKDGLIDTADEADTLCRLVGPGGAYLVGPGGAFLLGTC
jgi:predicted transglutaminase-like cysteine proteinase